MSPKLSIQEGAIFIADAHACDERAFFLDFLLHVETLKPTQLFLMGDMFDLLVGSVKYGVSKYQRHIEIINKIAKHTEIFYFEGNHDFDLQTLFKEVKVIPLYQQPLLFTLPDGRSCLLSHGDKFGNTTHKLFTAFIRNKTVLRVLNFVDEIFDFFISKSITRNQQKKNLCRAIDGFETMIKAKIENYKPLHVEVIAEGHYHQNCTFLVNNRQYVNFSSFACNQSYFIVQSSLKSEFVEKQLRGCNG